MRYHLFSFVAALVIALLNFFVLHSFQIANPIMISSCTFFFAYFAYSIDHYFDGSKHQNTELHERHKVSNRGFSFASKGFALTAVASAYFFYHMPTPFFISGVVLAIFSGIYFLLIYKKLIESRFKMVCAAVILSLVIAIWIFMDLDLSSIAIKLGYLSIVALAIFSNLRFFAWVDFDYDKKWFSTLVKAPISKQKMAITQGFLVTIIYLLGFIVGRGQTWMFVPLAYCLLSIFIDKKNLTGNIARVMLDLTMLLPLLRWFW